MGETRKRIIAAFTAVVLAVGLLPLPAFAAAGDYVATGAEGLGVQVAPTGFVAKRVYALIGNKYAVMVDEKAGDEANSTLRSVEVIDHSYNKVFEMTYATGKNSGRGGATSDYCFSSMVKNGFIVKARDTELLGVVDFEGHEIIPCKYEAMTCGDGYYFAALVDADDNAVLDVLSAEDGSLVATKAAGKADYRNASGTIPVGFTKTNTGYTENATKAMAMEGETFTPVVYLYRMNKEGYSASTSYDKIVLDGKELKLETVAKNPSYADEQIASGVTVKYKETTDERGYTTQTAQFFAASGEHLAQYDGWAYFKKFANDPNKVALVSAEGAAILDAQGKALKTFKAEEGVENTHFTVLGTYLVYFTSSKYVFYNAAGEAVRTVDIGANQGFRYRRSGYYLQFEDVKQDDGSYKTRIVAVYDSSLNKVTGTIPALGRFFRTLPDGTKVYESGLTEEGDYTDSYPQRGTNVLKADGTPVKYGGYALYRSEILGAITTSTVPSFSDVQVGTLDAFCAKDDSGKCGVVSSKGEALVPFEYDDIYAGSSNAQEIEKGSYAMAKTSDGAWHFVEVKAAEVENNGGNSGQADKPKADLATYAGEAKKAGFTDLDASAWYLNDGGRFPDSQTLYLDYTIKRGLMSGYTGARKGQFGPDDDLSRGMAATIIYRMATGKTAETTDNNVDTPFSDVPRGAWYAAAVKWCAENKVVTGYAGTTKFGPDDPITREQLATVIGRYMDPKAEAGDDVSQFKDAAAISAFAKGGIAYCNAKGIMTGIGDSGNFQPGGKASRCQMAKVIAVTDLLRG